MSLFPYGSVLLPACAASVSVDCLEELFSIDNFICDDNIAASDEHVGLSYALQLSDTLVSCNPLLFCPAAFLDPLSCQSVQEVLSSRVPDTRASPCSVLTPF